MAGKRINSLAYVDDVWQLPLSLTQDILDKCVAFAQWVGLNFNTKKCAALCSVNQPSCIYVDNLFYPCLGLGTIPALGHKYLGCPSGAFRIEEQYLGAEREALLRDADVIFESPMAEWQKLDAFCRFLFPRLSFRSGLEGVCLVAVEVSLWAKLKEESRHTTKEETSQATGNPDLQMV